MNAFNNAVEQPEKTRTIEQKQVIRMLKTVINNKYTVALASARNKREGSKIMGFFRNAPTSKTGGELVRTLSTCGYPSHAIFMSYPGYLSGSERHIIFTPQLQVILDYIKKASRFSWKKKNF